MLDILGYIFFVFAGLFFGLFGSGGSVIIIPILMYVFKLSIYESTTYSLLLVLLVSVFGTIRHIQKKNLHIQSIIPFIVPTLIFTYLSRAFLFPAIPDQIIILNTSKDSVLMIVFAIVVFCSGLSLFIPRLRYYQHNFKIILILIGAFVGLLTGLLGIGGGFIIVPSLVLFASMDIKKAASSTLFIIMLNTFLAIFLEITIFQFDFKWTFICSVLLATLIGITIGMSLLNKLDSAIIKKMFSIALLFLSLVIIFIELL
tara:strand:- start:664 stop:1437 length:774 start_codon:yes stop_codon:yes gene_type:complete